MSTIQIQKKKQLTFGEICPKWDYAIKHCMDGYNNINYELAPRGIYLASPGTCIVGEAWGFPSSPSTGKFSDTYSKNGDDPCSICRDFSMKKMHSLVANSNVRDDFVNHWNKSHV